VRTQFRSAKAPSDSCFNFTIMHQ